MNGQIIAGIEKIGQPTTFDTRTGYMATLPTYSFESMGFNKPQKGGVYDIRQFNTTNNEGFYKFLSRLIDVKSGGIYLKDGVSTAKWNSERLKALELDAKNAKDAQTLADLKRQREMREIRERAERIKKEGIACRSEADYEKAVDIKKRDGLHRAARVTIGGSRNAFLSLLRINAMGMASIMALKFAQDWDKWKNTYCKAYGTDWAKKGRESIVAPPSIEKMQRILYNLGFEKNSIVNPNSPLGKAIEAGMNKKAIGRKFIKLLPGKGKYERTLEETIQWYKEQGRPIGFIDGIGDLASITAFIAAATPIIMALIPFLTSLFGKEGSKESDILEEEIEKLKKVNDQLEDNINTLKGKKGIGQVDPSQLKKLEYIETEDVPSKTTRAKNLYSDITKIYNSAKGILDAFKTSGAADLQIRYEKELSRFEMLKAELKRLTGSTDFGKMLPYVLGVLGIFLLAKRSKK